MGDTAFQGQRISDRLVAVVKRSAYRTGISREGPASAEIAVRVYRGISKMERVLAQQQRDNVGNGKTTEAILPEITAGRTGCDEITA